MNSKKNKFFINIIITNLKNFNILIKILKNNNLLYHYDYTKISNIKYNKINFLNLYKKNYNYTIYSIFSNKTLIFNSSIWIYREYFDMFGFYNLNIFDNRKLLLNYSQKRGVLICC